MMSENSVVPSEVGRAWVEVDLDALGHNVAVTRALLPDDCCIMAIVKTDAYGHGIVRVAHRIRQEGVKAFAVATALEGVILRDSGLDGEILVLGYTPPVEAKLLESNDLLQLVIDGEYAAALNETGHKLRVHIAIDTGLHRLGIESSKFSVIEGVYAYDNLKVEGIATHFASSDGLKKGDFEYTDLQIYKFWSVVDALKVRGYDVGKVHAQASYGICNHPAIRCDYVRAGIMLYGMMSRKEETLIKPDLKPVLSLRAVVAHVRWINAGASVSYGRTFTTDRPTKIATVGLGYGDGLPRNISGKGAFGIVNGTKVPIIGRVCMDLLMLDVTEVEQVQAGDVATFIGKDGDEEILCEDLAAIADTITNEILCKLSHRLPRIYFEGGK